MAKDNVWRNLQTTKVERVTNRLNTKTVRVSKDTWLKLQERKLDVFGYGSMDHLIRYLLEVEKRTKT